MGITQIVLHPKTIGPLLSQDFVPVTSFLWFFVVLGRFANLSSWYIIVLFTRHLVLARIKFLFRTAFDMITLGYLRLVFLHVWYFNSR
jgi:hypothetical protein